MVPKPRSWRLKRNPVPAEDLLPAPAGRAAGPSAMQSPTCSLSHSGNNEIISLPSTSSGDNVAAPSNDMALTPFGFGTWSTEEIDDLYGILEELETSAKDRKTLIKEGRKRFLESRQKSKGDLPPRSPSQVEIQIKNVLYGKRRHAYKNYRARKQQKTLQTPGDANAQLESTAEPAVASVEDVVNDHDFTKKRLDAAKQLWGRDDPTTYVNATSELKNNSGAAAVSRERFNDLVDECRDLKLRLNKLERAASKTQKATSDASPKATVSDFPSTSDTSTTPPIGLETNTRQSTNRKRDDPPGTTRKRDPPGMKGASNSVTAEPNASPQRHNDGAGGAIKATVSDVPTTLTAPPMEWKREFAQNARDHFDHFRTQTFDDLSNNLLKLNRSSKPQHVTFVVTDNFDLNDQMEIWYSAYSKAKGDSKKLPTNFGCLFHDNDIPKVGAAPEKELLVAKLRHQVVQRWWILLSLNVENKEMKEVEQAIQQADMKIKQQKVEVLELRVTDEGGPTRHFFDRVWYQLEGLQVTAPAKMKSEESKSLKLFDRCEQSGLLLPVTDEKIERFLPTVKDPTVTKEKIECFFRAIGRMLAQCMLRTPHPKEPTSDDGPIAVPTHVLPNIFKTVLLRELDVTNEAYSLGALVDHCWQLLSLNVNSRETHAQKVDMLAEYIGAADDATKTKIDEAETSQERGRILREAINKNFISVARFTAIANLSNGVSLGGAVRWCNAFKLVPTKTVEKIVFGINGISHDMVFDESGDFRFIVFDDDLHESEKSKQHSDVQAEFKAMMKDLFREKLDEDKLKATNKRSFISNFIYFCTGSRCLPNLDLNPGWKIHVEFNCSEMDHDYLPVVHTCERYIKIPATAYGAEKEKFLEKLEASMRQTLESFDN